VVLASAGFDDWILCQLTSNPYADKRAVRITTPDFVTGSLQRESYARPGKLFTASARLMSVEAGRLGARKFDEVLAAVVGAFSAANSPSNPYAGLVAGCLRSAKEGKTWPLGGFPKCPRPDVASDAPNVLIFSPHPDDEVIIGGLALRLLREAKWKVINVAVTQGSSKARQAERLRELRNCCDCIGFDLVQTAPNGLERVNVKTREQEPGHWAQSVEVMAGILREHRPRVILFPHEWDWNSSHIGTHHLVLDALRSLPAGFTCYAVETEFWGQMQKPNLMVELSAEHVTDLITALTFHVGEVRRNPYHLSLPAWMIDNVRRGAELVGGQGGAAPDFVFGTLYRLRRWANGRLEEVYEGGRQLACAGQPDSLVG